MTLIPHRTVASQLAVQLRTDLKKGTWRGWLPSERVLSRTLQASRNTVRAALDQLKADKRFSELLLLRQSRLSVTPIPTKLFFAIVKLGA